MIQRLRSVFGPKLPVCGTRPDCLSLLTADQDQTHAELEQLLDPAMPMGKTWTRKMADQHLAEAAHEELDQPAAAQTT